MRLFHFPGFAGKYHVAKASETFFCLNFGNLIANAIVVGD
jgi:hypothetical protein